MTSSGCGRAAQHNEEKSSSGTGWTQAESNLLAYGWPHCSQLRWPQRQCPSSAGSCGTVQDQSLPLAPVLGAQHGTGQVDFCVPGHPASFPLSPPHLALPIRAPCPSHSQCPPAQSSAPQMHSNSHKSSAPTARPLPQHPGPGINCPSPDPQAHRGFHSLFSGSLLQGARQRAFWMPLTAALELFEALNVPKPMAGCTVWGHSSPSYSRQSNKQHQAASPVPPSSLESG